MSNAESTSISLLQRLRSPQAEGAWQRFVDLYAPLIFYWGRQRGLPDADAAELVQDVLGDLVTQLRSFQYDPSQRFRGWLRTIVVRRAGNLRQRLELAPQSVDSLQLDQLQAGDHRDLLSERQYRCHVALRALELLQAEFEASTWQAAWRQITQDQAAATVAHDLGMTPNAVYIAKSRVLSRLRQELKGLL